MARSTKAQRRHYENTILKEAMRRYAMHMEDATNRSGPLWLPRNDILDWQVREKSRVMGWDEGGMIKPRQTENERPKVWRDVIKHVDNELGLDVPGIGRVRVTGCFRVNIAYADADGGKILGWARVYARTPTHVGQCRIYRGRQEIGHGWERRTRRMHVSREFPTSFEADCEWPQSRKSMYRGRITIRRPWVLAHMGLLDSEELGIEVARLERVVAGEEFAIRVRNEFRRWVLTHRDALPLTDLRSVETIAEAMHRSFGDCVGEIIERAMSA